MQDTKFRLGSLLSSLPFEMLNPCGNPGSPEWATFAPKGGIDRDTLAEHSHS